MSIFTALSEYRSQKQYTAEQEAAIKMFKDQKSAIVSIKDTRGFKEILRYLDAEILACDGRIRSTEKTEEKVRFFDKRDVVLNLKEFLVRLSS